MTELSLAQELLASPDDLRFEVHAAKDGEQGDLRLMVASYKPLSLTTIMPHLSALGVDVTDEKQSSVDVDGAGVLLYDLGFAKRGGEPRQLRPYRAQRR